MSAIPPKRLDWLQATTDRISPMWAAFFTSLLLSLIAVQNSTINRDGMLYVDTARVFLSDGLSSAFATFQWPFLPILMALISQATGLGLESSGYLANALFMAGACALLVACAKRMFPEAIWYVCLGLLALPGFNGYRDELLREYGCWFFVMLSFWLALRWSDMPRWPVALAIQFSLVAAALFRPEALVFFPALVLWQLFAAPKGELWSRVLMLACLPLIGVIILSGLLVNDPDLSGRLSRDLTRFKLTDFDAKASTLAGALTEYARPQASTILLLGSLALIPLKFVTKMGILMVPLFYSFVGQPLRSSFVRCSLFAWAFLAHSLVLCVFVLDLQFLAGRYIAPLLVFSSPLVGYGLWKLIGPFPRAKIILILVAIVMMIANVVSTSPAKLYFVEAGDWLAKNATDSPRVYVESARAAYYAGWRYQRTTPNRDQLAEALSRDDYDLVILETSHKVSDIRPWLENLQLGEVQRFEHPNGDAVVIAVPRAKLSYQKPVP